MTLPGTNHQSIAGELGLWLGRKAANAEAESETEPLLSEELHEAIIRYHL